MDKLLYFPAVDSSGEPTTRPLFVPGRAMSKVASGFPESIQKYIDNMQPDPKKFLYMLLHAVGAGEYWGANVNGDYFPEESLRHDGMDYGHKTFERYAKLYKHHVNKDPNKSYGDVLHSCYDDDMHRVLLIIAIDRSKAPDICHKIECDGQFPDVSMGCKVPYDVCSICHHKAKSPRDYCDHAKYEMNKIYPDGRKVYVSNPHPRFFDISQVFIGAEKPAKMLYKIASNNAGSSDVGRKIYNMPRISYSGFQKMAGAGLFLPSSVLADKVGYSIKESEMIKEVPAGESSEESPDQNQDVVMKGMSRMRRCEKPIPDRDLKSMARHPLKSVLASLTSMGISLNPREFQKIILVKMGQEKLADTLDRNNILFDDKDDSVESITPITYTVKEVNEDVIKIASKYMDDRSDLQPHLFNRAMKVLHSEKYAEMDYHKEPSRSNIAPALTAVASLYLAYRAGLLGMAAPIERAVEGVARMAGLPSGNPTQIIPIASAAAAVMQGARGFSDPPGRPDLIGQSDRIKFAGARDLAILSAAATAPYIAREMAIDKARAGKETSFLDRMVYNNAGKMSVLSMLAAPQAKKVLIGAAKAVSKKLTKVGSANDESIEKTVNVVNWIKKQSNDNRYRRLMEDVVMNDFWSKGKISSPINPEAASVGTVIGLTLLGNEEE